MRSAGYVGISKEVTDMPLMERRQDRRPWGLIIAVSVALFAGVLSVPLQVITFQQVGTASQADVQRTQQLIEQVRQLEEANNADVQEHRLRSELLHGAICRQQQAIAEQAGLSIESCPAPLTEDEVRGMEGPP
jgi:hypothetical protein